MLFVLFVLRAEHTKITTTNHNDNHKTKQNKKPAVTVLLIIHTIPIDPYYYNFYINKSNTCNVYQYWLSSLHFYLPEPNPAFRSRMSLPKNHDLPTQPVAPVTPTPHPELS